MLYKTNQQSGPVQSPCGVRTLGTQKSSRYCSGDSAASEGDPTFAFPKILILTRPPFSSFPPELAEGADLQAGAPVPISDVKIHSKRTFELPGIVARQSETTRQPDMAI